MFMHASKYVYGHVHVRECTYGYAGVCVDVSALVSARVGVSVCEWLCVHVSVHGWVRVGGCVSVRRWVRGAGVSECACECMCVHQWVWVCARLYCV